MKFEIKETEVFSKWKCKIKDRLALKAIAVRLIRAANGNFGDVEPVGTGISEMRIFTGKGYRLYFAIQGNTLILLLNGGIKSNKKQQQADIALAKQLLSDLEK
jgi:putative addiction module killer protein